MTIAFVTFLLLLFLFIGMPVGVALGTSGMIGLYLADGIGSVCGIMSTVPYRTAASYTLTTVPMFILMAHLISESGIVEDCFTAARHWLERLPGGLAIASILASAGVAAMSGSSTASAASMSTITIPEMRKRGYTDMVSAGVVTVAGTLAIMIPPSIGLILYGLITENSIGRLFIAAIIPGLMTAFIYCLGIIVWNRVSKGAMPSPGSSSTWAERWRSLFPLWAFIVLVTAVLGSMYLGIATPTEAAAMGAFGSLVISVLKRKLSWRAFKSAVGRTANITTMIFTIIIGAMIFGYFLTVTQATQNLIHWIGNLDAPLWVIFGAIIIMYLILGTFMDQVAILLITLPLVYPLIVSMGYDPIWFGIIAIKLGEIGLVTPPIGMNAYVVNASSGVPLETIFRGVGVMLLFEAISVILLLAFPGLTTWLPSTMF
jgi:tripartite ATP-independent transporter DctM subunit